MSSPHKPAEPAGRPRLAPGSVVASRYVVEELLGEGGGGQVYRALDRELERQVAIKVLHAHRARSPQAIARMRSETALAQTITDRSVCRVYDFGMGRVLPAGTEGATVDADGDEHGWGEENFPYLSMELLQGETLSQRIERDGPLDPATASRVASAIAGALRSAHRAGVIHGDVKPSNVMLVDAGGRGEESPRVVLTDFGLSQSEAMSPTEADLEPDDPSSDTASADSSSSIAGTPLCLAPEQVLGQPLTRATDVYSFGVVLYHLLTGAWPFDGRSRVAVAMARLESEPVPLLERQSGLASHQGLVALVGDCLQRDPSGRPADLDAVLQRLEERPSAAPLGAAPLRVRRLAVVALGVLALMLAFLLWLRSGDSAGGVALNAGAGDGVAFPALPAFEPRPPTLDSLSPTAAGAQARWQAGLAALDDGDPTTAIRELTVASDLTDGTNALVWIELSRAWELAGNQRQALEAAQQAFALREGLPRGEQLLAEAQLRIAESDWERAATVLRALWEFYPEQSRYGYELAGVLDRNGRLEEALQVVREVRARFGRESAHLDLRESLIEYHLGDYDRSAELARAAAAQARALGSRLLEAEAFDLEALTRSQTSQDFEEVESLLREAEQAFRDVGHLAKVAAVNRRLGHVARRRGDFDDAERHYRAARSLAQESEDPSTFAGATGDLAILLDSRGEIETALGLKREVLVNYEERGIRQGAAITQENIGISLFKLGRLEEAMAVMRAAEAEYEALGDRIGIAWAPYYQGRAWSAMGRLELAQRSLDLATAAARQGDDAGLASYVVYEEAELAWMRGEYETALALNRECAEIYRAAEQARDVADADLQAARILGSMAKWPEAIEFSHGALEGYAELGVEQGVVESRAVLVLALAATEQWAEAREQHSLLEEHETEHGVARLRAGAVAAAMRVALSAGAARTELAGQARSELDALRREALDLGLVPLAAEIGALRLDVEPSPDLEAELRKLSRDRDLRFVLDQLPSLTGSLGVTDRSRATWRGSGLAGAMP